MDQQALTAKLSNWQQRLPKSRFYTAKPNGTQLTPAKIDELTRVLQRTEIAFCFPELEGN